MNSQCYIPDNKETQHEEPDPGSTDCNHTGRTSTGRQLGHWPDHPGHHCWRCDHRQPQASTRTQLERSQATTHSQPPATRLEHCMWIPD